jgi:hypothetical protein
LSAAHNALRAAVLALLPGRPGRPDRAPSRVRGAALGILLRTAFRGRHLAGLLDALAPGKGGRAPGPAPEAVLSALRRWPTTCLWRSVAALAALRAAGDPVRLVIGVRVARGELAAHAWLERDGVALHEREDPRRTWAVAFEHPRPEGRTEKEVAMERKSPNPDVILTELQDGSGVLLHLGTKFYYALNATGVAAWKRVAAGERDVDAIASELADRFSGAPPEAVRADVAALLAELRAEGLLPGA